MTSSECPTCWRAESSLKDRVLMWLNRPTATQQVLADYGRSIGAIMDAAMGRETPTWYERHRRVYEQTGDEAELTRMLRHV